MPKNNDKPEDTKTEPTEHDAAADRAGIDAADIVKVDGAKMIHADPNPVVDPGDANPVRVL